MTKHATAKPDGTPTWADVVSPNVEASRAFYKALFGWEYDIGGPEFGYYTTARVGAHTAAGLTAPPPGMPIENASWSLYFAAKDVNASSARATALGASVINPAIVIGDFGGMATLADPTGAAFSFWQGGQHVGTQVVDEPGAMAWCELYTSNAKQARDFYMDLLGATSDLMPGGLEYYVLKHGDAMLGGIMQIDPSWGPMPTQWVTYFAVANVDESVALITKLGGSVMGGVDDSPFGRIAAASDPQGAMFKIIQLPARPA